MSQPGLNTSSEISSMSACAIEWRTMCALDWSERAVKGFSEVYRVSWPPNEFLTLVNRTSAQYVFSPRHTELRPQTGASDRRSEECELRSARAAVLSTPLRSRSQVKQSKHTHRQGWLLYFCCIHVNLIKKLEKPLKKQKIFNKIITCIFLCDMMPCWIMM